MPIRVCYLIDRLGPGGTEWQLLALLRHLDRAQIQPYLVLLRGEDDESRPLEPSDCPVVRLGVGSLCRPRTLAKAWQFARFLRQERIDILQTYFADSSYFGMLAARLAGLRHVVRTRFNVGYWMSSAHLWLSRGLSPWTAATVTNSEDCRQAVIEQEWMDPARVHIIPNGVDLSTFSAVPPPRFRQNGRSPRVGMLARLRPVKDPLRFVEATRLVLNEHSDVQFILGGEGELRSTLESRIQELGLSRQLRLVGRVDDVPAFLGDIDIAVLCSQSEGSPNVVLEYLAAGRAVVATAVGGTSRLLADGVHGLLIPPGDAAALAKGIGRLVADPELASRLAAAGRERVRTCHHPVRRAQCYGDLYQQLVSSNPGTQPSAMEGWINRTRQEAA